MLLLSPNTFVFSNTKYLKIKIYKVIILPIDVIPTAQTNNGILSALMLMGFILIILKMKYVLCGCKLWSLTLREERRLRIFENRILRRIFERKRDENGEWKRLRSEEINSLYRSPNIAIRIVKSGRYDM